MISSYADPSFGVKTGAVRIGFAIRRSSVMDATWTTIALAVAALRQGHQVRFIEPWDWEVLPNGTLNARVHAFDRPTSARFMARALVHRLAERRQLRLGSLDLLMIRAAPWHHALSSFAQMAHFAGVRVVNPPASLLAVHHKGWLATLAHVPTPRTLCTRSRAAAHLFLDEENGDIVVKPATGSGGRFVQRVRRGRHADLDRAWNEIDEKTGDHVIIQRFISDFDRGEKRLIWLDGEVLGGYRRLRAPGEFRHNLKQGGRAVATDITDGDLAAVAALTPNLLRLGTRLAGLDLINQQITEVNVLNPGGSYHTDRLTGSNVSETIVSRLCQPLTEQESPWALPAP